MAIQAAVMLGMAGLGALGSLLGGRKKEQYQKSTIDKTTMPVWDEPSLKLRNQVLAGYGDQLENNQAYEDAYRSAGMNNIIRSSSAVDRAIDSILAARGLQGQGAATAKLGGAMNQARSVTDFVNSIPIMMDERKRAALKDAGGFFASMPAGQHMTGTEETRGTISGESPWLSALGGAAQGGAAYLGQYSANQNFLNTMKQLKQLNIPNSNSDASWVY